MIPSNFLGRMEEPPMEGLGVISVLLFVHEGGKNDVGLLVEMEGEP